MLSIRFPVAVEAHASTHFNLRWSGNELSFFVEVRKPATAEINKSIEEWSSLAVKIINIGSYFKIIKVRSMTKNIS